MSDNLTFSERQALIWCVETMMDNIDIFLTKKSAPVPAYVTRDILDSCRDKLGGNVELNTKRYLEEKKRDSSHIE